MTDKAKVIYERATASDREAIMAVLRTANFHHIPSPEMPELDVGRFFVARVDGRVVGVAGYKVLEEGRGKTTLMAVDRPFRRLGIGRRLQEMRMDELRREGCSSVVTNADMPEVIAWYEKNFGYRRVGVLPKLHEFGDPDVDHWTTLEADLSS